jgi:hypothetical protein
MLLEASFTLLEVSFMMAIVQVLLTICDHNMFIVLATGFIGGMVFRRTQLRRAPSRRTSYRLVDINMAVLGAFIKEGACTFILVKMTYRRIDQ